MRRGVAPRDPFILDDSLPASGTYFKNTTGLTPRQIAIDPTKQSLVLIAMGQSNVTSLQPTLYTPLNPTKVSHMTSTMALYFRSPARFSVRTTHRASGRET